MGDSSKPYLVEVKRTGKPIDKTYFSTQASARRFAKGVKVLSFVTGNTGYVKVKLKKRRR